MAGANGAPSRVAVTVPANLTGRAFLSADSGWDDRRYAGDATRTPEQLALMST
jgi:hypothetical protein